MLGKLLKYDLKWIYKLVSVFYILAILFASVARIFNSIDNSLLFSILYKVFSGCSIAMIVNCLINTVMRSWVRFVRNIYKDESYLTHTLPVSKKSIYLSKVLAAIISSFTTIIVIVLCLFICYYSKDNLEALKGMLEFAATTYNTSVLKLVFIISIAFFLEVVFILLAGYLAIIMGHKSNKNKMVISVLWGLGIYSVSQFLSLVIMFVVGLFNKNIMNIIKTTDDVQIDAIKILMIMFITIYAIYSIVLYLIGRWQFNKGVNVD